MKAKASIDIGSNSVLLLIAELSAEDGLRELCSEATVVGLGSGLDQTGRFSDLAMQTCTETLKSYAEKLKSFGLKPIDCIVTATEAARKAQNAIEYFEKIKDQLGFFIRVIDAFEEAELAASGVASDILGSETYTMMDMGGASTEFIRFQSSPFKLLDSISLPIGSVRARDWILGGRFESECEKLEDKYLKRLNIYQSKQLVAIAGTMTNLANIYLGFQTYSDDNVHGSLIDCGELLNFCGSIRKMTSEGILEKFGYLGKRSQTIISGACVFVFLAKILRCQEVKISTRGLRHGSLLKYGQ